MPESILNEARSRLTAGNIVGIDIGKVFSGAKIQCLKYDAPYQHTGGQYVSSTVRNAVEKYGANYDPAPEGQSDVLIYSHKLLHTPALKGGAGSGSGIGHQGYQGYQGYQGHQGPSVVYQA